MTAEAVSPVEAAAERKEDDAPAAAVPTAAPVREQAPLAFRFFLRAFQLCGFADVKLGSALHLRYLTVPLWIGLFVWASFLQTVANVIAFGEQSSITRIGRVFWFIIIVPYLGLVFSFAKRGQVLQELLQVEMVAKPCMQLPHRPPYLRKLLTTLAVLITVLGLSVAATNVAAAGVWEQLPFWLAVGPMYALVTVLLLAPYLALGAHAEVLAADMRRAAMAIGWSDEEAPVAADKLNALSTCLTQLENMRAGIFELCGAMTPAIATNSLVLSITVMFGAIAGAQEALNDPNAGLGRYTTIGWSIAFSVLLMLPLAAAARVQSVLRDALDEVALLVRYNAAISHRLTWLLQTSERLDCIRIAGVPITMSIVVRLSYLLFTGATIVIGITI